MTDFIAKMNPAALPGADGGAGVLQPAQQVGGHVLVVEGHRVDAPGERAQRRGVGVVAHVGARHDLGGRGALGLGQQAHAQPEGRRRLVHHAGELPAAHDADGQVRHPVKVIWLRVRGWVGAKMAT